MATLKGGLAHTRRWQYPHCDGLNDLPVGIPVGQEAEPNATLVRKNAGDVVALVPSESARLATRSTKWKLDVNAEVDVDA